LGGLVFIPLYAAWVTLLLPGVWASMLAGALYGTWWGSLIVFVGACLGAEAAFLLGRYWLRDWTSKRLKQYPKLQAVERAVSREGLKLVLLTRLSPAFPFSLLNLVYGLSEVSLRDYTIGLIGILPGTILFCALGALAGDAARFGEVLAGEASAQAWILRVVGVFAKARCAARPTNQTTATVAKTPTTLRIQACAEASPASTSPKRAASPASAPNAQNKMVPGRMPIKPMV
jgi:uncharacterized membrane protein YdjX (TVP38/TMEM64 family)